MCSAVLASGYCFALFPSWRLYNGVGTLWVADVALCVRSMLGPYGEDCASGLVYCCYWWSAPPASLHRRPFLVRTGGRGCGSRFYLHHGAAGDYFLIETMGAGGAFLDYDQDGWLDIYLVDGFDLSHLRGQYSPINLSYRDETHYWVEKDYRPGLSFKGLVDESAYQVAPATADSPRGIDSTTTRGRDVSCGSRCGRGG